MFGPLLVYGAAHAERSQAVATAENAQREARGAKERFELLQCDVERLLMITEALWTFLKQQHGYKDDDLAKLVSAIDMRDGRQDGRVAPSEPRACPHCGHILGKARPFCYYCGKPVDPAVFQR